MQVITQAFKGWLKSFNNMKLSSDALVLRLSHEGITNFASLSDFDKKSNQNLPNICKNSIPAIDADASSNIGATAAVSEANVSSILVSRLVTSVNAVKYYGFITQVTNLDIMSYSKVLATLKVEHEACISVKDEAKPKFPKTNDRDNTRKIICWHPIFKERPSSSCGSRDPLSYVLRKDSVVPD